MTIKTTDWIYHGGRWVRWDEATVHVSTHALHYGSSAFEGIRAYEERPHGKGTGVTNVFRLDAHIRRLFDSARMLRMDLAGHSAEAVEGLCCEAVARNGLQSCYIRPIVFRGAGGLGLNGLGFPVELAIFAVEWGRYLGQEAIEQGVDAAVSSWRRFNAATAAPLGKIGGQYVTNQLASIEARQNGFAEGILLDADGLVTEGAGENIFLVKNGTLTTPGLASSILSGITRDTVIHLAQDLGIPVRTEPISRDLLYIADELFMTGTAAEISPLRSIDRLPVGDGKRGPITKALQEQFFGIVEGRLADRHGWLTPVSVAETAVSVAEAVGAGRKVAS
jgi:branched-chain amino acid aminotransferase